MNLKSRYCRHCGVKVVKLRNGDDFWVHIAPEVKGLSNGIEHYCRGDYPAKKRAEPVDYGVLVILEEKEL